MKTDLVKGINWNRLLLFLLFFYLSKGCTGNKRPEHLFSSAIRLWSEGKYEASIKCFESLLDLYPNHELSPEANFWIGEIHYTCLSDFIHAIYNYRKVIKRYPKSRYAAKAQWKIAKVLSDDLLKKEASIKEYQTFTKTYPNHPLVPNAYYNIAEAYIYLEDYGQAITELELFLQRYPDSEMINKAFQRLGELYYLVKVFPRATKFLKSAYELSEGDETKIQIKELIAECHAGQGNISKALELYEEILEQEPENKILINRIKSLKTRLNIKDIEKKRDF